MHSFVSDIDQLRGYGFAEALPMEGAGNSRTWARMECGRLGLAVEFLAPGSDASYSLVPLGPDAHKDPGVKSHLWDDILRDLRRRLPLDEGD